MKANVPRIEDLMRRLAEAEDRRDILKFATDLERAIAWSNPCAELIERSLEESWLDEWGEHW